MTVGSLIMSLRFCPQITCKQKFSGKVFIKNRNIRHTLGVVHAGGWVVIDCRVPQESVIRIVSTMGTKESIS